MADKYYDMSAMQAFYNELKKHLPTTVGFGTCATAAATATKEVVIADENWKQVPGSIIGVKFTNSNTANSVKIKVNDNEAASIFYNNAEYTSNGTTYTGNAGRIIYYMFDGTYWVWKGVDWNTDSNTYTSVYCGTGAATAAKVGTCTNYYNTTNPTYGVINIVYTNTVQSALTLNINSQGAKPLYINGQPSSTTNYDLPRGMYIFYWDGTNYYINTDGTIPFINSNIQVGTDLVNVNGVIKVNEVGCVVDSANNAFAVGQGNTANGVGAFAAGQANNVNGLGAAAIGVGNTVSGIDSVLIGIGNGTDSYENYGIGVGNSALSSSHYSFMAGMGNKITSGENAIAIGCGNNVSGTGSVAIGVSNSAHANYSHAEGFSAIVKGDYSHAEGENTIASGNCSHAEGSFTSAIGYNSHAEGYSAKAEGTNSHAEGGRTNAIGTESHAEGSDTSAIADFSHAEGYETIAGSYDLIEGPHVQGEPTTDYSAYHTGCHAEGMNTTAYGDGSHAEGIYTYAGGIYQVEGDNHYTYNQAAHSEGLYTSAIGEASHAGGHNTIASGIYSFAHGEETSSIFYPKYGYQVGAPVSFGIKTVAVAEPYATVTYNAGTTSYSYTAHYDPISSVLSSWSAKASTLPSAISSWWGANGKDRDSMFFNQSYSSTNSGEFDWQWGGQAAFGIFTTAIGRGSFVAGKGNATFTPYSFVAGKGNAACEYGQTVVGVWNSPIRGQARFVVGAGTSDTNRKNSFYVTNGGATVNGVLSVTNDLNVNR
jgi:hypothetical protein